MDGESGTYSARSAARLLGTSAPRVLRAVEHSRMRVERSPGGRVLLTERQVARLRKHLGSGSVAASLPRTQLRLLAALVRAPRGVTSVRALARRARVAPSTVSKYLPSLKALGLVEEETRWIAEGRARRRTVVTLNDRSSAWAQVAGDVRNTELPSAGPQRKNAKRVPARLDHLFWNVADSQKIVNTSGAVIARRLIETADLDGLAWGLEALSADDWRHAAATRGISSSKRAMAENFAAAAPGRGR